MRAASTIFILLLASPFIWFGGVALSELWSTQTYRYRLSMTVSVDGQLSSGIGVLQVRHLQKSAMLPQRLGGSLSTSGEAVIANLGERGPLFLLMKDVERASVSWVASIDNIVQSAFPPLESERSDEGARGPWARYARGGEIRELKPEQLPRLVRFRDVNDEMTIEVVDPQNLVATLGSSVRFVSATIETVPAGIFPFNLLKLPYPRWLFGEPVTRRIRTILPWLSNVRDTAVVGYVGAVPARYGDLLTHGDFVR